MERRIRDMPSDGLMKDEQDNAEKSRIAMITFAYNNPKIINQLKERGTYIKTEQWDQLKKMNEKMATQFRANQNSDQIVD